MAHWLNADIGSIRVPVTWRDRSHDEIVAGTIGAFDKVLAEIWVGADLSRDMAKATLMHELAHATIYILGIEAGDHDEEESHVKLLSAIVFDVLQRNKMLVIPDPPEAA